MEVVERLEYESAKIGRVIFAKLSEGEELIESIKEIASKEKIKFGVFFLIGTLRKATFGFYHPEMRPVTMEEPLEITSCIGNIVEKDGKLKFMRTLTLQTPSFTVTAGTCCLDAR